MRLAISLAFSLPLSDELLYFLQPRICFPIPKLYRFRWRELDDFHPRTIHHACEWPFLVGRIKIRSCDKPKGII